MPPDDFRQLPLADAQVAAVDVFHRNIPAFGDTRDFAVCGMGDPVREHHDQTGIDHCFPGEGGGVCCGEVTVFAFDVPGLPFSQFPLQGYCCEPMSGRGICR